MTSFLIGFQKAIKMGKADPVEKEKR